MENKQATGITGEQLQALENMIFSHAKELFEANNVPPTISRIVMGSVCGKFQEFAVNELLVKMIQIQNQGDEEKEHTGTPGELIKSFEETGFTPDAERGNKG